MDSMIAVQNCVYLVNYYDYYFEFSVCQFPFLFGQSIVSCVLYSVCFSCLVMSDLFLLCSPAVSRYITWFKCVFIVSVFRCPLSIRFHVPISQSFPVQFFFQFTVACLFCIIDTNYYLLLINGSLSVNLFLPSCVVCIWILFLLHMVCVLPILKLLC